MTLDTGCDFDLISSQTLRDLSMSDKMDRNPQSICICLNGGQLSSIGTITLRWKGKRFRKTFITTFHVIDDSSFPCQVILGADTITENDIVKFAGFGGRKIPVLPKKTREEANDEARRKDRYSEETAANGIEVDEDIRRRAAVVFRQRIMTDDSSSSRPQSSQDSDDKQ
ncbi:hypothetical protein VTL71DRAFT_13092 [Oculimacula yallundae]|uniref:Aspartic peptidase DDI1-type domain-containing protein n=1 Tax=Oculimacula yallundae TaxID=86028 RepID=A0ABR4CPC8_9HELO